MKIVLVPLDDRPCNIYFPKILPIKDNELVITPKEIMGNIKTKADIPNLKKWIRNNIIDSDYLIIALDTLIYGGLIPSRLHHDKLEELIFNLEFIKGIKNINPNLKIYGYITIMRTPNSYFNSEEPDYYNKYGKEIFKLGVLLNKELLNIINEQEKEELKYLKGYIPIDIINDYIDRRNINLEVTKKAYELYLDKYFDYFYIPQDDSSPYGFTRIDQLKLKDFISEDIAIFPGADEVGLVLLSRAILDKENKKIKIFVRFTSSTGETVIPSFEDRMIDITISNQIMTSGGVRVYSLLESDAVMVINIGSSMAVFPKEFDRIIPYDINRNLSEIIEYIKYSKSLGKLVGVADVAIPTGADIELIKLLDKENLLLSIDSYAGWNTASNTIGTVLSNLGILYVTHDYKQNKHFLIHRYYDDVGYCSKVRTETDLFALSHGYSEAVLDGRDGMITKYARKTLIEYMNKEFKSISRYLKDIKVTSPWNRTFEMQFDIIINM